MKQLYRHLLCLIVPIDGKLRGNIEESQEPRDGHASPLPLVPSVRLLVPLCAICLRPLPLTQTPISASPPSPSLAFQCLA